MIPATAFNILIIISIILAICGIVRPAWPCTAVAVLLVAITVLVGKGA